MIDNPVTPPLEELLQHAGWLRRLAARLVAGPHDADDIVQEVWRATLATERADVHAPRAWLAGALRNVIKMRARSDASRQEREHKRAARVDVPSASTLAGEQELRRKLLEHVDALPDTEREVVVLRFYRDLPPREVAAQLNIPVNTVRTRTARGLQRLRERLDEQHGDRREWCLALLPLLDPRGLQAVGLGAMARRTRGLLATAAVAAIATAGYFGYEAWNARQIVDLAQTTPADEVLDRFVAQPGPGTPPTERRVAPQPQRRFAGKVVDLDGRAIENAMVHFGSRQRFERLIAKRQIRAEDWSRHSADDGSFAFAAKQLVHERGKVKLGPVRHPDYEPELGWSAWNDDDSPELRMRPAFDATIEIEVVERGTLQPMRFRAQCQAHWGEQTTKNVFVHGDPKLRSVYSDSIEQIGGTVSLAARLVAGAHNKIVIDVPGGPRKEIDLDVPDAHGHVYRFREELTFDAAAKNPTRTVLRGTVTDAETKKPLHGVRVRRVHVETAGRTTRTSFQTTQTRSNGSYALGYAADSAAETLQFEHPDYLQAERSWRQDVIVDVGLQRKPSLTVHVLDAGRPLADLPLLLAFGSERRRATTNAQGLIEFGSVPARSGYVFVLTAPLASDDHALLRRTVDLAPGKPNELVIEMQPPDRVAVLGRVARLANSDAVIAPLFLPLDQGRGWVQSRRVGRSGYTAGDMRRGTYLVFLAPTNDRFRDGPFAFSGIVDLTATVSQVIDTVVPTGRVQGRLVGADSWQDLHVIAIPELPHSSQAVQQFLASKKLGSLIGAEVTADGVFTVEHVADGPCTLEVRRGATILASRRIAVQSGFAAVSDWQVEG